MSDDHGENRTRATLSFDLADAPMLYDALMIGRATVSMCGAKEPARRMAAYAEMLKALLPPIALRFNAERWAEMGAALKHATRFRVHFETPFWGADAYCLITVGEQTWKSDDWNFKPSGEDAQAVFDAIHQIAPLDCAGVLERVAAPVERRRFGLGV